MDNTHLVRPLSSPFPPLPPVSPLQYDSYRRKYYYWECVLLLEKLLLVLVIALLQTYMVQVQVLAAMAVFFFAALLQVGLPGGGGDASAWCEASMIGLPHACVRRDSSPSMSQRCHIRRHCSLP